MSFGGPDLSDEVISGTPPRSFGRSEFRLPATPAVQLTQPPPKAMPTVTIHVATLAYAVSVQRGGGVESAGSRAEVRTAALGLQLLVDHHGNAVQATLVALERDPAVREELWSDVFALAYRRIGELERLPEPQCRSWLLRAARNLTANSARRAMTRRRALERLAREPIAAALSAEEAYFATIGTGDAAQLAAVRTAWNLLSSAHREVLALDALGLKGPVIAERLGLSHQAARSRLM